MAYKGKGKEVNRTDLAATFAVSLTTIDGWVRAGCPAKERGKRGVEWKFNTADVQGWLIQREREAGAHDPEQQSVRDLQRRAELAKTLKAELELEKARNAVAPLDQIQRAMASAFAEVRANMRNLPSRTVKRLLGETNEVRFKAVMLEEIDQALETLADSSLVDDVDPIDG